MFFEETQLAVKLLSVLDLRWGTACRTAEARPYHALSFRILGNVDFTYDKKDIHVGTGDLVYVPKGVPYRMEHTPEHVIVVHFDILEPHAFTEFELLSPHNKYEFEDLFRLLYTTWTSNKPGCQYAAASVFYKIMREVQKERWSQGPVSSFERLSDVIAYIHASFTDSTLSVHTLAKKFGTSETYFRNVFKEAMQKTPLRYINDLRIAYATELLRSGYYSVTEIAEKTGFSDPKYFSKIMKAAHDVPPSVLKKQSLE